MEAEKMLSQIAPPIFDGDNYQVWAVRMKAHLVALDVWEAVEENYEVSPLPEDPTMAQLKIHKERKNRKSKAKACLFAAVSNTIFTRIMNLEFAKDIWDYLQKEYKGNEKMKNMQVLNLIREFEMIRMKESETIKEYSNKLLAIVNNVRLMGKDFSEERIVQKVLVTLLEKYESKISALEEAKDLSSMSMVELVNAIHAQEQRRMMREGVVECALLAKAKSYSYPPCRHCKNTNHPERRCWWRPDIKCRKCGQIGHMEKICSSRNEETKVAISQHEEELF